MPQPNRAITTGVIMLAFAAALFLTLAFGWTELALVLITAFVTYILVSTIS